MEWMLHRKQRETKQQPSMLPSLAVTGCCLVSFCFLCDIHSIHSVKDGQTMLHDGSFIGTINMDLLLFVVCLQSGASYLSRGFVDNV